MRQSTPIPVLGASWNLAEVVAEHDVESVVIAFSNAPHDVMLSLLDECARLGIRTLVVPRLFERVPSRLVVTHVGGLPLLETLPTSPKSLQFAIKYVSDRVAAALLVVLLAPLLAAIAVAVRVSLGRPILYRQHRVGLDGRQFEMLKFRTMRTSGRRRTRTISSSVARARRAVWKGQIGERVWEGSSAASRSTSFRSSSTCSRAR